MEQIQAELEQLFEQMIKQVGNFKRKTYEGIFKECHKQYKDTIQRIEVLCEQAFEEERNNLVEGIAKILPDYAQEKISQLPKRKKEREAIDYNMNMAVFIVPLFYYEHKTYCEKIGERMVAIWNERDITGLSLGQSSYEIVAGGFRNGFCYITTAVCEHQHKADDCYELTTLRNYRDDYLMQTESGRSMVEEYYDIAPTIVKVLQMQKASQQIYENLYSSYIHPCIQHIEKGEQEACKEKYMEMVWALKKKYLYSSEA